MHEPEGWNLGVELGTLANEQFRADNEYIGGAGPRTRSPGALIAWDPIARQPRWQVDYDFSINGGTLSTAGNLVFQGGADGVFRAFAADDGELLWQSDLGVGIMAAPMTYEMDGVQYVSVLVGWGGSSGLLGPNYDGEYKPQGRLWTFRLDGGEIIPVRGQALPELTAIPFDNSPDVIALGADKYAGNCVLCHGQGGVSGGAIADLRYASQATYDSFMSIVRDGAYAAIGMQAQGHVLSDAEIDAVKNYLLSLRAGLMAQ